MSKIVDMNGRSYEPPEPTEQYEDEPYVIVLTPPPPQQSPTVGQIIFQIIVGLLIGSAIFTLWSM